MRTKPKRCPKQSSQILKYFVVYHTGLSQKNVKCMKSQVITGAYSCEDIIEPGLQATIAYGHKVTINNG